MRTLIRFFFIVLVMTQLAACVAMYPLGMTEQEWNRLSPVQQLEAREKQAELDAQRRRERIAQQERKEREERQRRQAMLDDPNLLDFREDFCFGGEKCPDGNRESGHVLYLGGRAYVDSVEFEADDMIGHRTGGRVAVYADRHLVADNLDILRRGSHYRVRVGRICRNIILRAETDDEVRVHWIAVYGDRDGMRSGSRVIIIGE